jgi:bifunctional DNA-binding transcriptional regulator/antitoxin component of YhaV-PrlF toxin-antitoxin module
MLYRNTFPEFLEAISIGPNPSFLENNTDYCEFAKGFPQEVELMYDWKAVKKSSDPLNTLRSFTKKFILYGPDLDVQTLNFFVKKVNVFPSDYSDKIKTEVEDAFERAKNIRVPTDIDTTINQRDIKKYITYRTPINQDNNFLNKLAQLLRGCKKPCNYFKPISSSVGTLGDFGRAMSDNAMAFAAIGDTLLHAPVNVATNIVNKIKPAVRNEFFRLKIAISDLTKTAVRPFYTPKDVAEVKSNLQKGIGPDSNSTKEGIVKRLPLTNDTQTYFVANESHSEVLRNIQEKLGDCFRMFDHHQRYNPYDPEMNASYAKRKYMGLKNDDVKSLVDVHGSLAPAKYATENTYSNALDTPKQKEETQDTTQLPNKPATPQYNPKPPQKEALKYQDTPKAPKYDTYDGPSKGAEQVVTAGTGVSPIQATGSETQAGAGLENVPATGKEIQFGFGEVKLTYYGYIMDECPDTGSELAVGNANNMVIPLKTVAINPEAYKQYGIKPFDVLIITVTDSQGNTWIERRQVADSSASIGQLGGGKLKMVIDEFVPTRKGSKLAGRTSQLKLKIQIADTKEPKPVWNVQQASQFAPIFFSKNDWLRAIKFGSTKKDPLINSIVTKMKNGEFDAYIKWSNDETVYPEFVNHPGCDGKHPAFKKPKK